MFEAKLQMRLQSGEPKCANCHHWDQDSKGALFGVCRQIRDVLREAHMKIPEGTEVIFQGLLVATSLTTDLTVCSGWRMKHGEAETQAEAR